MKELKNLIWQSDCNGYELGYDDVAVVGIYMSEDVMYYVDTETMKILEVIYGEDDI